MTTVEATIEVERRGDAWAVRMQGSAGTVKLPRIAPLSDADLAELAGRPENAAGWPDHARTWRGFVASLCPNPRFLAGLSQLEAVGALLRGRLFEGASEWLSEMDALASRKHAALRFALVLDEDTPELEEIPWELCRQGTSFLFKRGMRVAARCVGEMPFAPAARLRKGHTLLIATAHEDGRAPSEEDLRKHAEAVRASAERVGLVVEHLPNATPEALRRRLLDTSRPLHALYAVCHGQHDAKYRGRLALRGKSVSGTDLASWVAERAERTGPLEAVILCACSSSVPAPGTSGMAQWLVKKDARWDGVRSSAVRASVGFRGPVIVTWALGFMERVFEAVGDGATIDVAVSTARTHQTESDPQWALPLLYTPHLDASAVSVRSSAARSAGFESFVRLASLLPRAPVPYFVAREREREQLAIWLQTPGSAAITSVAGEGGVGKTELAHVVAHDAARGGRTVLWLDAAGRDLRTLASNLLRHAVPDAHIRPDEDDDAVAGRAREALRPHGGLLVLDDIADAHAVRALSPGGSWNVLVTTRTPGLVPGVEDVALQLLTVDEGMVLLARIAWDTDTPPPEQAEAVRRLVSALGGLPLAIELAGHTIRSGALSAAEYLASYHLPEGPAASDRERAEAALLRARRDLDEDATQALHVMALMPLAGATRAMVATASGVPEPDADRALVRLRRLGMVGFVVTNGRYTLHPIVRGAVRREVEADVEAWERVLSGAERAMGQIKTLLVPGEDVERARRHWLEVRDMVSTLDLAPWEQAGKGSVVLALLQFAADQFRWEDSLEARLCWLEAAERLAVHAPAEVRASVLFARGNLRKLRDDLDGALADIDEVLALAEKAHLRPGQAEARAVRGEVRFQKGDIEGALEDFDESLKLLNEETDPLTQANLYRARGVLRAYQCDLVRAEEDIGQALYFYERIGNHLGQAAALKVRGDLWRVQRDFERASSDYDEALRLFCQLGDLLGQANVRKSRGDLRAEQGDVDGAEEDYERARALYLQVGSPRGLAQVTHAQGDLAMIRGDAAPALSRYQQAETTYREIGDVLGLSNVLAHTARARFFAGKKDAALRAATEALDVAARAQNMYALGVVQQVLHDLAAAPPESEPSG